MKKKRVKILWLEDLVILMNNLGQKNGTRDESQDIPSHSFLFLSFVLFFYIRVIKGLELVDIFIDSRIYSFFFIVGCCVNTSAFSIQDFFFSTTSF